MDNFLQSKRFCILKLIHSMTKIYYVSEFQSEFVNVDNNLKMKIENYINLSTFSFVPNGTPFEYIKSRI